MHGRKREREGGAAGRGGGLHWGLEGGHQCTAAKLMPFFSSLRHREAECGGSLTETRKDTGGENEFIHSEHNLFYQKKKKKKYPGCAVT